MLRVDTFQVGHRLDALLRFPLHLGRMQVYSSRRVSFYWQQSDDMVSKVRTVINGLNKRFSA
jgi:hypothetical protein